MKKQHFQQTEWGIACKIGKVTYLNKNLDKYPKLKEAILNHEKEHSDTYRLRDVWVDLNGKHLASVKKEYYMFFLRHPKALVTFLPVWKYNNVLVFDPIMIFMWVLCFSFIFLLKFIGNL